jgi:hypothetical protein
LWLKPSLFSGFALVQLQIIARGRDRTNGLKNGGHEKAQNIQKRRNTTGSPFVESLCPLWLKPSLISGFALVQQQTIARGRDRTNGHKNGGHEKAQNTQKSRNTTGSPFCGVLCLLWLKPSLISGFALVQLQIIARGRDRTNGLKNGGHEKAQNTQKKKKHNRITFCGVLCLLWLKPSLISGFALVQLQIIARGRDRTNGHKNGGHEKAQNTQKKKKHNRITFCGALCLLWLKPSLISGFALVQLQIIARGRDRTNGHKNGGHEKAQNTQKARNTTGSPFVELCASCG